MDPGVDTIACGVFTPQKQGQAYQTIACTTFKNEKPTPVIVPTTKTPIGTPAPIYTPTPVPQVSTPVEIYITPID